MVRDLHEVHAFDVDFPEANPWPCPGGGQVAHVRWYTWVDNGLQLSGNLEYDGCRATSGSAPITGALTASIVFATDSFGRLLGSFEAATAGSLRWTLGSRSGDCSLDLTASGSESGTTVAGIVCGASIEVDLS